MARKVVPFMACGDLRGLDSDQTYSLKHEADYEWRPPVQRPIHPAYTEVSSSSATAVCYCVCVLKVMARAGRVVCPAR